MEKNNRIREKWFGKLIIFLLLIFLYFIMGCAPAPLLKKIELKPREVRCLKDSGSITVVTNDGNSHTIKNWKIEDTRLIGEIVTKQFSNKETSIPLSDIDHFIIKGIRIKGAVIITERELKENITTNHRIEMSIVNPLIYLPLGFFPSMIAGFILGSQFGTSDDQRIDNGVQTGLAIWGLSTLYVSYLGYRSGELQDQKKAREKIEQQRSEINRAN